MDKSPYDKANLIPVDLMIKILFNINYEENNFDFFELFILVWNGQYLCSARSLWL